jgi:nucleotide-binding universal stress UspA family protein
VRYDIPAGRRIVVGVDGSPASVAALAWAAREAQLRQAELHAVYAWEDVTRCHAPYAAHCDLPSRQESRAAAASLLASSVRAAFGQAPPRSLRMEVAEGRPERVLPGRAADCEMLVLGSTRRAGDFPAAGPVHRACLRSAPCPLVFVGPPATNSEPAGPTSAGLRKGLPPEIPPGRDERLGPHYLGVLEHMDAACTSARRAVRGRRSALPSQSRNTHVPDNV